MTTKIRVDKVFWVLAGFSMGNVSMALAYPSGPDNLTVTLVGMLFTILFLVSATMISMKYPDGVEIDTDKGEGGIVCKPKCEVCGEYLDEKTAVELDGRWYCNNYCLPEEKDDGLESEEDSPMCPRCGEYLDEKTAVDMGGYWLCGDCNPPEPDCNTCSLVAYPQDNPGDIICQACDGESHYKPDWLAIIRKDKQHPEEMTGEVIADRKKQEEQECPEN